MCVCVFFLCVFLSGYMVIEISFLVRTSVMVIYSHPSLSLILFSFALSLYPPLSTSPIHPLPVDQISLSEGAYSVLESEAVLLVNITRTGRAGDQVSVELESRTFFSENPAQGLSNTTPQYCTTIISCEVSNSIYIHI